MELTIKKKTKEKNARILLTYTPDMFGIHNITIIFKQKSNE